MVLAHDTAQGIRTQDVKITNDITFGTMLLTSKTLKGLNTSGFHKPSPIQLHGIPLGKCGFDLLLEAKSGTGKTAVFAVICLEKLDLDNGLQAVMLAPTREIAAQICDVLKEIGSEYKDLNVAVVMGGLPIQEDIKKFKNKVHVVVGSPGRLRYLIQDGYIDTSSVRLLVLDEADKLMEKSFQADINYIFSALPKQKQVIMSSATFPEGSKTFLCKYVKNSQHVCPNTTNILLGINQKVTFVKCNSNVVNQTKLKYDELLKILTKTQFKQCLIFCNYQVRVTELHKLLTRDKWPSEQLYGSQEQTDRLDALKTLQEYKCRILISTDLAARGIDASNVDLVINFEPPYDWQTYLHRIGRAGRFGSYGTAITILSRGAEETKFNNNLSLMKKSLILSDLWTDEKYDLEVERDTMGNTSKAKENNILTLNGGESNSCKDTKEILQELWNEIASSPKQSEVLENFEDLMKSFESSFNVESFPDLLQSFENGHCNTVDSCFVHMKMGKTSTNNYKIYLQECLGNFKKSPTNTNSSKRQELAEVEDHIVYKQNKNISNEEFVMNIEDQELHSNDNHLIVDDENDSLETEKEMLLLGLPTSFVSKRDQIRNVRDYKSQRNKEFSKVKQDTENNLRTGKSNRKKHNSQRNTQNDFESRENGNSSENNDEKYQPKYLGYLQDMEESREPYVYSNKSKHYVHKKSDIRKCGNSTDNNTDDESVSSSSSSCVNDFSCRDNYNNWFKQLKIRTRQIEMAFYLEEISKM